MVFRHLTDNPGRNSSLTYVMQPTWTFVQLKVLIPGFINLVKLIGADIQRCNMMLFGRLRCSATGGDISGRLHTEAVFRSGK